MHLIHQITTIMSTCQGSPIDAMDALMTTHQLPVGRAVYRGHHLLQPLILEHELKLWRLRQLLQLLQLQGVLRYDVIFWSCGVLHWLCSSSSGMCFQASGRGRAG